MTRTDTRRNRTICSVRGCSNFLKALGWCQNHYHAWRKYGDPLGKGGDVPPRWGYTISPAGRRYLANRPRRLIRPSKLAHGLWRMKAYRDLLGRGMDSEQARRVIACCEGLAKGAQG